MPGSAFRPPSPPTLTSAGCRDRPAIYSGRPPADPGRCGRIRGRGDSGPDWHRHLVGRAVSAVVISRLATYWLPVLPGWLAWRLLRRLGYV